jgi:hypothetical protein
MTRWHFFYRKKALQKLFLEKMSVIVKWHNF